MAWPQSDANCYEVWDPTMPSLPITEPSWLIVLMKKLEPFAELHSITIFFSMGIALMAENSG